MDRACEDVLPNIISAARYGGVSLLTWTLIHEAMIVLSRFSGRISPTHSRFPASPISVKLPRATLIAAE